MRLCDALVTLMLWSSCVLSRCSLCGTLSLWFSCDAHTVNLSFNSHLPTHQLSSLVVYAFVRRSRYSHVVKLLYTLTWRCVGKNVKTFLRDIAAAAGNPPPSWIVNARVDLYLQQLHSKLSKFYAWEREREREREREGLREENRERKLCLSFFVIKELRN